MLRNLMTFLILILSTLVLVQAVQAWFVEQTDDGDSDVALSILFMHVIHQG
ncbi:hypothetical protein [Aquabacterium sp.]|uniref:hypothetical protein n=1 Tax=Aquabacterium sp. TaxID=1872578 RepID=UPI0025BEE132|nr:hypothetical protein [Aquabacterium sp.]